jgi:hypothetical protein
MQRVIRTELYFNPLDIEWRSPERIIGNAGISMVFYRGETPSDLKETAERLIPYQPQLNLLRYRQEFFPFLPPYPLEMSDERQVRAFLDCALQNDTFGASIPARGEYAELNTALINQIFEQSVVVENSPPDAIPFRQLLSRPSILVVGTFLGMQLSGMSEMLFLAAPAGIVVVGSAVAIARAIDQGLNHYVDRLFGVKEKRPRRRKKQSPS